MNDLVSNLPTLALAISRALHDGLEKHIVYLRAFEKWLTDAHFVCDSSDILVRVEKIPSLERSPRSIRFLFARRWQRKPMRIPMLIIESRIVLSKDVLVELVIQRSEENYLVVSAVPGSTVDTCAYAVDALLDSRHDDIFPLALRRMNVRSGRTIVEAERIGPFLKTILDRL